jgi:hypothetical protein
MTSFEDAIKALDERLRKASSTDKDSENSPPSRPTSVKRPHDLAGVAPMAGNKRQKLATVTNCPGPHTLRDNTPTTLSSGPIISPSQPQASQVPVFPLSALTEVPLSALVSPQFPSEVSDNQDSEIDYEDDAEEETLAQEDLFNDELDFDYDSDDAELLFPSLVGGAKNGQDNAHALNELSGHRGDSVHDEDERYESVSKHAPLLLSPNRSEDELGMPTPSVDPVIPVTPGVWNGVTCNCQSHPCDTSLPPNSALHVDKTCKILQHFDLSFHRFWRYVICNEKMGFIPLGRLSTHLFSYRSSKKLIAGRTNTKHFRAVVEHISSAFQIPKDQVAISPPSLTAEVAGIKPPVEGRRCAYCGWCGQWSNGYSAHCLAAERREENEVRHGGESTRHYNPSTSDWRPWAKLDRVFMQALFHGGQHQRDRVFVEILNYERSQTYQLAPTQPEENITLNASRYVIPKGPSCYPPFVKALGWDVWLEAYLAGGTIDSLISRIAIPRKRSLLQPPSPASPLWFEYVVTMHIRPFLEVYLEHANDWLDLEGNTLLRDALTRG